MVSNLGGVSETCRSTHRGRFSRRSHPRAGKRRDGAAALRDVGGHARARTRVPLLLDDGPADLLGCCAALEGFYRGGCEGEHLAAGLADSFDPLPQNGAGGEERHDVGGVVGGEHRVEGRVEFKPTLVGHGDAGYRRLETEWLP